MKKVILSFAIVGLMLTWGCAGTKTTPKTASLKSGDLNVIYFDYDKSDISAEAQKILKQNAKALKESADTNITLEGHCDERGSDEYNTALGYSRANSAKSYLTSLGVSSSQLKTKSYGEDRPAKDCHEEKCWSKNRRVEFVAK